MQKTRGGKLNRISIGIQSATLIAVIALFFQVWPAQVTSHQASAQSVALHTDNLAGLMFPLEVDAVFAEIEATMSDPSKWPTLLADIESLQAKLKAALNSLSPRDQEQALPRLIPRRWEIQALWLMSKENEPSDAEFAALRALADEMDLLQGSAPSESSAELIQQLKKQEALLREMASKSERKGALELATAALTGKGGVELFTAIRRIAAFDDEESKRLGYQLGLRSDLDLVMSDLDQWEKLTDPKLTEFGLTKLLQNVMDLRLRVAVNLPKLGSPEKTTESLISLEKKITDGYEKVVKARRVESIKRMREYQTWALNQIREVPTLQSLKDAEIARIPGTLDRNNPLSKARKEAEERAMAEMGRFLIAKMAPIHQGLIDEAVSIWYRKVFQERFEGLNEPHKLRVVIAFSSADKRQIDQ